jgi:hypothetical protein
MRKYVKDNEIPWLIVQDDDRKTMKAFGADSFPDYYIIDRNGKVRFADLANSEVDRAVEMLLKEKVSK